jgi:feruloyl-CoA synthase
MPTATRRPVSLAIPEVTFATRDDGSILVRPTGELDTYPIRITARLEHWAAHSPEQPFIARRTGRGGPWRAMTYAQTLAAVRAIGTWLLDQKLSAERPVAILSGNDIEHALLALACLHVGIPYAPISVAYSTISTDFAKLRHIFAMLTPGLVFAADGARVAAALKAVAPDDAAIVVTADPPHFRPATLFADLLATPPQTAVDQAAAAVGADTIGKILFTSGSTGVPKGVINTQRMLCSNQEMLCWTFPVLRQAPPVIVDWLPWNHTFGGNHNFGLVLYNGGTLYMDDGKPVPGAFEETVRNLREIAPTLYFNVPKGYEELAKYLRREPDLRKRFFSRVGMLFYAAAGLGQHIWDEFDEMAEQTIGHRIQWMTGLGSTETGPFALSCHPDYSRSGVVGLPVAGCELKLAPVDGKLEARVRGPSITPGFWRNPQQSAAAFDDEGFYRMGDALVLADPNRPEAGFRFDGRIAEDFKLATGTWVSVGPMRARLIAALAPYMRDVVVAGHDRDFISIIMIPDTAALQNSDVDATIRSRLTTLAGESTGSATRVIRAMWLHDTLSIDAGEITDKGSINQRALLAHRRALVEDLYAEPPPPHIISIEEAKSHAA